MEEQGVLKQIYDFAKLKPNKIALIDENSQLTYQDLVNSIEKVSIELQEKQMRGKIVAVQIPRSVYFPILMLALSKEKIAFVPQDLTQPIARLNEMIDFVGAQVVITLKNKEFQFHEIEQPRVHNTNAWALYFTSGSTGKPKAVEITWQNIENIVSWQRDIYQMSEMDRVAAFTPYSYAISYIDIFPALCAGATLYILNERLRHDLGNFETYLQENKITFMNTTSMIGELMIRTMNLPSLRLLTLSGQRFPNIDLKLLTYDCINVYGNTECGAATIFTIDPKSQKISLGKPVKNMRAHILGQNNQVLADGEEGELFISGPQVSSGYFLNSEATQSAFISIQDKGQIINGYRTGDFARFLPDGNIDYLGRRDRQYKINGVRIDLMEIERTFQKIVADMNQCFFAVHDNQLCCWFSSSQQLDIEDITREMKLYLPSVMMPTYIKQLEKLPIDGNGKIDELELFRSLPHENKKEASHQTNPKRSEGELYLLQAWGEILNIDPKMIGPNSDFRKLGATSLQIMELGVKILQDLNKKVNFVDLYYHTKLSDMACFLNNEYIFQPIYTFVEREEYMGDSPALFVIHSGNTGSDVYRPLFDDITSPEYPIYVIEPHNLLTPDNQIYGVENISAYYLELIESFLPEQQLSNYNLMGWSYGGVVATEMCRQTERTMKGKHINHLMVIDSPFYLTQNDLFQLHEREANGYYTHYFKETHIFKGMDKKNITTEHLIKNNHQVFQDLFHYKVPKIYTPTIYIRSMVEEKPLKNTQIQSIFNEVNIKDVYAGHDYLFVNKDSCLSIQKELGLKTGKAISI